MILVGLTASAISVEWTSSGPCRPKFPGKLVWLELRLATLMAVGVTLLILLNIVTRYFGAALYWVDELAIYAMVWMTFLGASAALHYQGLQF